MKPTLKQLRIIERDRVNEIERIDINVVNKLIVAIMPTYQAVNEPIEIEI